MEDFFEYLIHQFTGNLILPWLTLGLATYFGPQFFNRLFPSEKGSIRRKLKSIVIRQLRIFLGNDWIKIDKQVKWGLCVLLIILYNLSCLPSVNMVFIHTALCLGFFMVLSGPGIKPKLNNWELIKSVFLEYKWLMLCYVCSVFCLIWRSDHFGSNLLYLLIVMIITGGAVCLFAILPRVIIRILRPFVKLLYEDKNFRKAVYAASYGGLIFIP